MKPLLPEKSMLPLGLLFVTMGIILRQLANLPDFADGILFGAGIGLLTLSLIVKLKRKTQSQA